MPLSKPAFSREILILLELYHVDWTEPTIEAFYEAIQDLPQDLTLKALRDLIMRQHFMPKPAEVRELVQSFIADQPKPEVVRPQGFHNDDPALCERVNCESPVCQAAIVRLRAEFNVLSERLVKQFTGGAGIPADKRPGIFERARHPGHPFPRLGVPVEAKKGA